MNVKTHIRFALALIVLLTSIVFVYEHFFSAAYQTYPSNRNPSFHISGWTDDEVVYDKNILSVLNPDKIIYKRYQKNGMPPITLFVSYYNTLEKTDLSHSPIVCSTGQGWEIENTTKKEIPIGLPHTPMIKINQIVQKKLGITMITLFWYQSNSYAYSNRGIQKLTLFLDKLSGKSDSNAFVRISVSVPEGICVEDTTRYLFTFIQDMYPDLRRLFLEDQR